MGIIIFCAALILATIIIVATYHLWDNDYGLEVLVFLFGTTSLIVLSLVAISHLDYCNKKQPKEQYEKVTETFYRKIK